LNLSKSFTVPETSLSGSRCWRFDDPSLHCFWLIHSCDGQTDEQWTARWTDRIAGVKIEQKLNEKQYLLHMHYLHTTNTGRGFYALQPCW